MTTVALHACVSTKDKGHSTENQLPGRRRFAQAYGYTVYKEYVEQESGGTGKRSEFQALFADEWPPSALYYLCRPGRSEQCEPRGQSRPDRPARICALSQEPDAGLVFYPTRTGRRARLWYAQCDALFIGLPARGKAEFVVHFAPPPTPPHTRVADAESMLISG
jgi:hypothetical protein